MQIVFLLNPQEKIFFLYKDFSIRVHCNSHRVFFSFFKIEELSGRFTLIPAVNKGAVTIKIINRTNITSTNGVTFISEIDFFI